MTNKVGEIVKLIVAAVMITAGTVIKIMAKIELAVICGYVLIGAGIFIAVVSVVKLLFVRRSQSESPQEEKVKPEYRRKRTILSRPEWDFLQLLKGCINPEKHEIDVQVPLVAVIDKLTQNSYRNELFRVADFLIVDSTTYAPLLLVELNDASHERADRAERDRKVNEICASAGMPIVAFSQAEARDPSFVKKTIQKNMLKK